MSLWPWGVRMCGGGGHSFFSSLGFLILFGWTRVELVSCGFREGSLGDPRVECKHGLLVAQALV